MGSLDGFADAISRINVIALDEEELYEGEEAQALEGWKIKLMLAQMRNRTLQSLKAEVLEGLKKSNGVRDEVFHRRDNRRLKLVIPKDMMSSLLFQMHDNMSHLGDKKTVSNIRRIFFQEYGIVSKGKH